MNAKAAGLAACLAIIVISIAAPLLATDKEVRIHQHRSAPIKEETTRGDGVFATHLPLVEIDTEGAEIPGKVRLAEDGRRLGYSTAADGSDTIFGSMDIVDQETSYNHVGDTPTLSTKIEIRARGNSSRRFDKSSYYIRLLKEDDTNNPQPVMGMDAHHEWALHGPYLDKTLIRNYMWYNISGEIMDYAPNVRFCEVMLNGDYQGVYVMTELITAGKDGARLSLTADKKRNSFTGYLLRLDRGSSNPLKNLDHFTRYTKLAVTDMNIVYPGSQNLTEAMARGIRDDISQFEKALYSYDFDDKKYGYQAYIDVDSFVNYFLINEITGNYDAGIYSTYIYKDIDGKYRMCVWDFNNCCDNYQEQQIETWDFRMQSVLWYYMLMKDEDFTQRIIDRYRELRKTVFSNEYLDRYTDETIAYLGDAVGRNFEKWGYSFGEKYDLLMPRERNLRSYGEAVSQLKAFYKRRLAWMDENIETLRQYSAESKNKKYNDNAN